MAKCYTSNAFGEKFIIDSIFLIKILEFFWIKFNKFNVRLAKKIKTRRMTIIYLTES